MVSKLGCSCNHLIKNELSHPTIYGNDVNKFRKFKLNSHGLKTNLNNLIRLGESHSFIIKSLNLFFIGTNIDFLVNTVKPV